MGAGRRRVTASVQRLYWREADAQVVVDAWRQSGLSLVDFARRQAVHPRRVARWARRLPATPAVRFHPVQLVERSSPILPDSKLELVFADGRLVRVPAELAAGALRHVLEAWA